MSTRKLSESEFDTVVNRQAILTGSEAVKARLVDGVLYEDEVINLLRKRLGLGDSTDVPEVSFKEYMNMDNGDLEGGGSQIAVVYATGGIISGVSRYSPNPIFGGDMVGSGTFMEAMREVRENEKIKAVVVRVESPGGDASASEAMWREVELTRKVKPVIISMAGVAASGGYFLAAAGDMIVAEPTTLTGSIGVFYLEFDLQEFFRSKIGINTEIIETNPHADMFVATDEEGMKIIARSVDTTYERFLNVVAQGRKLPVDSVRAIAQGRVWTGEQASKIGLVDVLGGLDTAIAIAARRGGLDTSSYRVRVFPKPPGMFDILTDAMEVQADRIFSSRSTIDEYQEVVKSIQENSGTQARAIPIRLE
jgi:protease-4